jgi:hypothetical protein
MEQTEEFNALVDQIYNKYFWQRDSGREALYYVTWMTPASGFKLIRVTYVVSWPKQKEAQPTIQHCTVTPELFFKVFEPAITDDV